jgi:cysteine-rich repeat protein
MAGLDFSWLLIVVLSSLMGLTSCTSSDDGPDPFARCGNVMIDKNEQCDDGNSFDIDDCLSTCVFNQCGDEFLNIQGPQNAEMCDGRNLNNRSCFSLGFQGGTLTCDDNCTFDTSACTPRPTPEAGGASALTTPTPRPTPTATIAEL